MHLTCSSPSPFFLQVKEVSQSHYLANFVQCIFESLPADELTGSTLVVSGDGRYYNKDATILILRMAAANGVRKIIMGEDAIMSTPCVSGVIRSTQSYGGIILTASHNPGGPVRQECKHKERRGRRGRHVKACVPRLTSASVCVLLLHSCR